MHSAKNLLYSNYCHSYMVYPVGVSVQAYYKLRPSHTIHTAIRSKEICHTAVVSAKHTFFQSKRKGKSKCRLSQYEYTTFIPSRKNYCTCSFFFERLSSR